MSSGNAARSIGFPDDWLYLLAVWGFYPSFTGSRKCSQQSLGTIKKVLQLSASFNSNTSTFSAVREEFSTCIHKPVNCILLFLSVALLTCAILLLCYLHQSFWLHNYVNMLYWQAKGVWLKSALIRDEVLVFHRRSNIEVTRAVIQCLRPGSWLNDEVG